MRWLRRDTVTLRLLARAFSSTFIFAISAFSPSMTARSLMGHTHPHPHTHTPTHTHTKQHTCRWCWVRGGSHTTRRGPTVVLAQVGGGHGRRLRLALHDAAFALELLLQLAPLFSQFFGMALLLFFKLSRHSGNRWRRIP